MNRKVPLGLDTRRVQQLLEVAKPATGAGSRIDRISAELVGQPYQTNPLIGSPDLPEVFTADLKGFDCVTFIESVLALAQSANTSGFVDRLRRIRYSEGQVEWTQRNHYMTAWIRNNARSGIVQRLSALRPTVSKDRLLEAVPRLPARRTKFACVPKASVLRSADKLETGDLIFFASTRKKLDVFHCGILVNSGKNLVLRHASKSKGGVVEQKLAEFLKQNRMAGVLLVRAAEVSR